MACYKNTFALREKVPYQIGNGMCFTGTRRSLHQNSIVSLDAVRYFKLFFVRLFRKQYINALSSNSSQLLLHRFLTAILR